MFDAHGVSLGACTVHRTTTQQVASPLRRQRTTILPHSPTTPPAPCSLMQVLPGCVGTLAPDGGYSGYGMGGYGGYGGYGMGGYGGYGMGRYGGYGMGP